MTASFLLPFQAMADRFQKEISNVMRGDSDPSIDSLSRRISHLKIMFVSPPDKLTGLLPVLSPLPKVAAHVTGVAPFTELPVADGEDPLARSRVKYLVSLSSPPGADGWLPQCCFALFSGPEVRNVPQGPLTTGSLQQHVPRPTSVCVHSCSVDLDGTPPQLARPWLGRPLIGLLFHPVTSQRWRSLGLLEHISLHVAQTSTWSPT